MNIAFFPNMIKDRTREIACEIVDFLTKRDVRVYAEDAVAVEIDALPLSSIDISKINYAVSLGGTEQF